MDKCELTWNEQSKIKLIPDRHPDIVSKAREAPLAAPQ